MNEPNPWLVLWWLFLAMVLPMVKWIALGVLLIVAINVALTLAGCGKPAATPAAPAATPFDAWKAEHLNHCAYCYKATHSGDFCGLGEHMFQAMIAATNGSPFPDATLACPPEECIETEVVP